MGFATDDPNAKLIHSSAFTPSVPGGNFINSGGSTNLDSYPSTGESSDSQQSVTGSGSS